MNRYILSSILSILIISFSPVVKAAIATCTSTPGYPCVPKSGTLPVGTPDSQYPKMGFDSATGLYKVVYWDDGNELYTWVFNSNLVLDSIHNITYASQIPERPDISNSSGVVVFENYQYGGTAEISTISPANPSVTTRITANSRNDLFPSIYSSSQNTTLVWQHNYIDDNGISRWEIQYKRDNNVIQTLLPPAEQPPYILCPNGCGFNTNFATPIVWNDLVVYEWIASSGMPWGLWVSNIVTNGSSFINYPHVRSPHIHDNRIAYIRNDLQPGEDENLNSIFTRDVIDANTIPHITLSAETPVTMPTGCTIENTLRPPRIGGGSGRYIVFGFSNCGASVVGWNNLLAGKTSVLFLSYRKSDGTQYLYKVADLPHTTFGTNTFDEPTTYDILDNMIVFENGTGMIDVVKINAAALPFFYNLQP